MSPRPPAMPELGRRERRKRATRRALLDAGLALIGEHGVYATRIEDVTGRADVGKGAFYNYFDSKTALVASLLVDANEVLETEYLNRSGAGPALADRLEAAVHAHDRFFRASPARALLFHQARGLLEQSADPDPVLRDAFSDYLLRLGQFLYPGRRGRVLLESASVVAGAIAGYRSFTRAAGLPSHSASLVELLVRGMPPVSSRKKPVERP